MTGTRSPKVDSEQSHKDLTEDLASNAPDLRTDLLNNRTWGAVPFTLSAPYGFNRGGAMVYLTVPRELALISERHKLSVWRWRIELHDLGSGVPPLGLDIIGNVILGRNKPGEPAVDIDLGPYEAGSKGVSRRHALLKPTANRLFLIDLSSTNGTKRNEMPISPGMAIDVQDKDSISLANLNFIVRVIRRPYQSEKEENFQPLEEDDTTPF